MKVTAVCRKLEITRQAIYKATKVRQLREYNEQRVLEFVRAERQMQPMLGGRKLCKIYKPKLAAEGIHIGRDKFFEILRKNDLLVEHQPRIAKTTNSRHSLPVFFNLAKEMELTAPNQMWMADITYLRVGDGFAYASLLTDAYSRKIVGYYLGDSLETIGCVKALEMALADLPDELKPLHHSDRGCQYCSHLYVNCLREAGLKVSMTEEMHCYENALAERVNGILKMEYGLYSTFSDLPQAKMALDQAVWLYNNRRPHMGLNYAIPAEVHVKVAKIA